MLAIHEPITQAVGQAASASAHPEEIRAKVKHDAGAHETGWRRAECGIEPAALAKAKAVFGLDPDDLVRLECGACTHDEMIAAEALQSEFLYRPMSDFRKFRFKIAQARALTIQVAACKATRVVSPLAVRADRTLILPGSCWCGPVGRRHAYLPRFSSALTD